MAATPAESLAHLHQGDHVCAVYDSPREQLATVAAYVRSGLDNGERCVYIVDDRTAEEVLAGLRTAGVDVNAARGSGRLVLTTKRDSYLQAGVFDPDKMIAALAAMTDSAVADNCTGLRVTGEMTWALGPEIGCDRLIEYETKLNRFFPGSRAHAMCQYNRQRFTAEMIRDVLRTHPIAVIGDQVCPNLYYEPPELLGLAEGDARRVDYMIDQLLQARRRETQLAQAVAVREEFLSIASHELKTPVNALRLALTLVRRRDEMPQASLAKLDTQVDRLASLIERLLDMSRLNASQIPLEVGVVALHDIVRERVTAFAAAFESAGCALSIDAGAALADADQFRVEQIVDNLLSNALKYGKGSPVHVSTWTDRDRVFVRVADRGIGIPAAAQRDIFKRFVRLESTQSFGGFGLGLWIAQEMASRMNGRITVTSVVGSGSTFTLELPASSTAVPHVH